MTKDEFYDHLRQMRGEFYLTDTGMVRHKTVADITDEAACPIEALCSRLRVLDVLDNADAGDDGIVFLELDHREVATIIEAADDMHDPDYPEDRRKLLAVLGLGGEE